MSNPTVQLPDPDGNNESRAIAGGDALQYFAFEHGERTGEVGAWGLTYVDPQSGATTDLRLQNLADLLSNLAHYCDDDGLDFGHAMARAAMNYLAETDGAGTQLENECGYRKTPASAAEPDEHSDSTAASLTCPSCKLGTLLYIEDATISQSVTGVRMTQNEWEFVLDADTSTVNTVYGYESVRCNECDQLWFAWDVADAQQKAGE